MSTSQVNLAEQVFGYLKGTKAAVEAVTGMFEGAIAYAIDTNEFGSYDGSAWTWGQGGSFSGDVTGIFKLSGDIAPTALSADVNDYNPTGLSTAAVLRLEASGANRFVTGLADGADGRIIVIRNTGATYAITLVDESASSAEANRFSIGGGGVTLEPGYAVVLQYDSTLSRWTVWGTSAAALQGTKIKAPLFDSLADGDMLKWNAGSGQWEDISKSVLFFLDSEGNPADIGTAADGTSTYAARRDHVHGGPISVTNVNDIFRCDNAGASAFAGTIATLPGGAVLTYNVTSGQENAMVPTSTSQLGKMRLYNTTRGTSALISNCVIGTNTITLTANVPAGWIVGDVITIASQTVSGGGFNWVDIEITGGDYVGKSLVFLYLAFLDSGGAGQSLVPHPFETYGVSKLTASVITQSTQIAINTHPYKLTSNIISLSWTASGAATALVIIRQSAYIK